MCSVPDHSLKAVWGVETLIFLQGCPWLGWGGARLLICWKTMDWVSSQRCSLRTPEAWRPLIPPGWSWLAANS